MYKSKVRRVHGVLRGVHDRPGIDTLVVRCVGYRRGIQAGFPRHGAHRKRPGHRGAVSGVVHHLLISFQVHFVMMMMLLLRGHEVVDRERVVERVVVLRL